ncbi:hypothetical protein Lbru_1654 [Legionella brunensis]|uniref:Uncharacterized protein n=2 Tax=Legionella brunensis TaxID=29422 RepID=A0A0W0SKA1_9GAMM|nr:hypothetical protein Lbru_1654 [Legionella brunensis]
MLIGFRMAFNKIGALGFSFSLNNWIFVLIAGLVCVSVTILCINWTYIHSEFTALTSMLMYEAYNPQSAPNLSYYQWKYSLNPAKVTLTLLVIPMLLPLFYYIRIISRNKKSSSS